MSAAMQWVMFVASLLSPAVLGLIAYLWNRSVNASEGRIMDRIGFVDELVTGLKTDLARYQTRSREDAGDLHKRITEVAERTSKLEGILERRKP